MKRIVMISCFALFLCGCWITGEGQHTGYITAIEQDGMFWKPYIIYFKTDKASTQEDKYCVVDNSTLIVKMKEYQSNQTKVTIKYKNEAVIAPWRCNAENCTSIIYETTNL